MPPITRQRFARRPATDQYQLSEWLTSDAMAEHDDIDDIPTDSKGLFEYMNAANNHNLPIPAFPPVSDVIRDAHNISALE
jgi:hypothetical protein